MSSECKVLAVTLSQVICEVLWLFSIYFLGDKCNVNHISPKSEKLPHKRETEMVSSDIMILKFVAFFSFLVH